MSLLSELLPSGGGAGGAVEAVASGALSNGDMVVVNSDGTVSVISGVAEDFGSATTFSSGSVNYNHSDYSASTNKVVVAYQDQADSNNGKAVVGAISGTTITFGSPVVFNSGATYDMAVSYSGSEEKFVICYRNGLAGTIDGIVGTISGSTITLGSASSYITTTSGNNFVSYDSGVAVFTCADSTASYVSKVVVASVSGTSLSFGSLVSLGTNGAYNVVSYDSASGKAVIVHMDGGNSNYGTAVVGTVSGTSISLGSPVVYFSGSNFLPSVTYDGSSNTVVISYTDYSSAYVIAGSVSGSSITFGSSATVKNSCNGLSSEYDPSANKVAVYNKYYNGSSYNNSITVCDISGTSITVGSESVFNATVDSRRHSVSYDGSTGKCVAAYFNFNASNVGTAVAIQLGQTNLTSDNFIGISSKDYADGATATIQVAGATDDAQSGLTAGTKYYVQTDGTLSSTAGDPSVVAGVALSSTELLLTGE